MIYLTFDNIIMSSFGKNANFVFCVIFYQHSTPLPTWTGYVWAFSESAEVTERASELIRDILTGMYEDG